MSFTTFARSSRSEVREVVRRGYPAHCKNSGSACAPASPAVQQRCQHACPAKASQRLKTERSLRGGFVVALLTREPQSHPTFVFLILQDHVAIRQLQSNIDLIKCKQRETDNRVCPHQVQRVPVRTAKKLSLGLTMEPLQYPTIAAYCFTVLRETRRCPRNNNVARTADARGSPYSVLEHRFELEVGDLPGSARRSTTSMLEQRDKSTLRRTTELGSAPCSPPLPYTVLVYVGFIYWVRKTVLQV